MKRMRIVTVITALVMLLHQLQELAQLLLELWQRALAAMFYVYDGDEVVVFKVHDGSHILELILCFRCRTIEMIASHFQSYAACALKVSVIGIIHELAAFRSLQIDVCDVTVPYHLVPVDFSLIV